MVLIKRLKDYISSYYIIMHVRLPPRQKKKPGTKVPGFVFSLRRKLAFGSVKEKQSPQPCAAWQAFSFDSTLLRITSERSERVILETEKENGNSM
ncbi:MAG TPA: hypothetical protein VJ963_05800 [Bacteroidales bacterium]|nr:hypothetical protein [Bacteroidales bacterium]